MPNAYVFVLTLWYINTVLLAFNMLPVYPLDGGQNLRSLLWFVFGRARSLMIATIIGFIGVIGLVAFAFWEQSIWIGILCVFILLNCWGGLTQARALIRITKNAATRRVSPVQFAKPLRRRAHCGYAANVGSLLTHLRHRASVPTVELNFRNILPGMRKLANLWRVDFFSEHPTETVKHRRSPCWRP